MWEICNVMCFQMKHLSNPRCQNPEDLKAIPCGSQGCLYLTPFCPFSQTLASIPFCFISLSRPGAGDGTRGLLHVSKGSTMEPRPQTLTLGILVSLPTLAYVDLCFASVGPCLSWCPVNVTCTNFCKGTHAFLADLSCDLDTGKENQEEKKEPWNWKSDR